METQKATNDKIRFYLTAFIVAVSLLGDGLIYAILPSSPEEFGIRIWQIGILLSANRIIRLITNEITGRIVNNDPSLKPLIIAAVTASAVTLSYTIPWGFYGLLFSRLVWGGCFSLLRIEGYLSALKVSTTGNRSRVFAVYQAITRFGAGGGAMLGGLLSDIIGIKLTFLLFASLTLGGTLLLRNRGNLSIGRTVNSGRSGIEGKKDRKILLFLGLSVFSVSLVDQMFTNLTGRIVVDSILPALPPHLGAATLTGILVGSRHFITFLAPLIGWVSDRAGRKKALFVFIIAEALTVLFFVSTKSWIILLGLIISHFVISCASGIILYSYAGDRAPEKSQAVFMSRFTTFNDLGIAAGPLLGFAIYSGAGLFWVGAAAVPLLITVAFLVRKIG